MSIDVYAVGILSALKYRRAGWLRREFRNLKRRISERNWNAVRNSFSGYLAEPCPWPEGLRRCGSGWTKKRALNDLKRRMAEADR